MSRCKKCQEFTSSAPFLGKPPEDIIQQNAVGKNTKKEKDLGSRGQKR